MTCLHTINRSPSANLLPLCASLLSPGDALLFLEDGTYYCTLPGSIPPLLTATAIYALQEDLLARGTIDRCTDDIEIIDYDRFVALCCEFDKVINWF